MWAGKGVMAVLLVGSARCLSTHPSIMAYPKPFPLASPPKPQQAAFAPDLSVRLICPDCRDPNPTIVEEFGSGDLVCAGCGLVLGDRIVDTRSEWRVCDFSRPLIYFS
jgi:TFIIB zinc-binding